MRQRERGVALVMVILVLLILTVLGITAVMMMTQEDKISSRQELQKAALYAAETGLRNGEKDLAPYLQPSTFSYNVVTQYLNHTPVANTAAAPPSAGANPQQPVPPSATPPPQWDLQHLGTYLTDTPGGVTEKANQEVTMLNQTTGLPLGPIRVYYSLYVRNNPDDLAPGGALSPLTNYDSKLRLISVGFVTDSNGVDGSGNARVLSVKILEEELNASGAANGGDFQKGKNPGSTYSGLYNGKISG